MMPGSPSAICSLMAATAISKKPKIPFTQARQRYCTLWRAYIAVVALTTKWAVALQASISSIIFALISF
jgi:hypothetical protein